MESARCIVVAGAGDVGMRLARLRARAGDDAVALRRRDVADEPGIRHLRVDLASGEGFARLPRRPDALVFCAAPDERSEQAYRRLFVDGLRRLLDGVEATRVIFVSSTAVFSEDAGEWVDETTPARATSFNGRILLEAEADLAAHREAIALRFSGIYGPGRDYLLWRARGGESNRRHWTNRIHVDDAAAALSHLLDLPAPERCYLGNDDAPVLECDVMAWLRQHEGLPLLPAATGAETGRRVSNGRLRRTGWSPAHADFRSGYLPLLASV